MTYTELNKRAEDRISSVPMFFAFSKEQFNDGLVKLGVSDPKEELLSVGGGGFIKKVDMHLLNAAYKACEEERKEFLSDMTNLKDAFQYELANHEYCITYDDVETWEALGLSIEDSTEEQRKAYVRARELYLSSVI